jgi:hypothetical protein
MLRWRKQVTDCRKESCDEWGRQPQTGLPQATNRNCHSVIPDSREGPIKSELCLIFIIRHRWKKKAQEVKRWSNFTNAASKS